MSRFSCFCRGLFATVFGLGLLTSVVVYKVAYDDEWKRATFARVCSHMTASASPNMRSRKCNIASKVHGTVVEIGPGPGTSLECLSNNSRVTKLIGIEPNAHMRAYYEERQAELKPKFDIELHTGVFAENMHMIPDQSVDSILSLHVLCSVTSTDKVLREMARILKPGGTLAFFEHVHADDKTHPYVSWIQDAVEPAWKVAGDGCQFKDTKASLKTGSAASLFENVQIEEFDMMDMPVWLSLVRPHISGTATRKS
jgi:ubiquinone/menaquinone biosynthesis C-methylase UbiE